MNQSFAMCCAFLNESTMAMTTTSPFGGWNDKEPDHGYADMFAATRLLSGPHGCDDLPAASRQKAV